MWATEMDWDENDSHWKDARADLGLIDAGQGRPRLDVWRSCTVLPGYITCIEEKEEIVAELASRLREFVRSGLRTSSLSILLTADPGGGKTALAEALAKAAGARFISYNITSMYRRDEVLNIFEAIGAIQASGPAPVLVFVDEINAPLEQGSAYDVFLSPVEDRRYARRGQSFLLRPCAWIFAGTRAEAARDTAGVKYSDFMQRMTVSMALDYVSLIAPYSQQQAGSPLSAHEKSQNLERIRMGAKLEQVYLGATMIGLRYPHVQRVTKEIVQVFQDLDPEESPSRQIRRLVYSARDVHSSLLAKENCTRWGDVYWSGDDSEIDLKFRSTEPARP